MADWWADWWADCGEVERRCVKSEDTDLRAVPAAEMGAARLTVTG